MRPCGIGPFRLLSTSWFERSGSPDWCGPSGVVKTEWVLHGFTRCGGLRTWATPLRISPLFVGGIVAEPLGIMCIAAGSSMYLLAQGDCYECSCTFPRRQSWFERVSQISIQIDGYKATRNRCQKPLSETGPTAQKHGAETNQKPHFAKNLQSRKFREGIRKDTRKAIL